ncbi:hypothetical protein J5J83_16350 [Azoarcus sp. L1K30]|uniref:hypothetical protein n=1 Tax=Azoarcus sp. L1K30 TaxID=2820277 RepID=UPI001B825119|nr:hypothetical protein [Azoarcus sp. L1K30]MBR0567697.1 hypothetical protein [Azoarcus sp. L1K30]
MNQTHSHPHSHGPARHRPPLRLSPLGTGLGLRLLVATAASTLLWATVLWAVN